MFREIAGFEIRYHLRQPLIWLVSVLFFALTFGAITTDSVQIGGAIGSVNRNAPYVIMQFLLVMSMIAVFATTAFLASAVLRDEDHRTSALFFTTPVRKRDYVLGRFAGAFFITLVIFVPIMLAILIGSWMPWLDPERIGPTMPAAYAYSFAAIVFPNMFLMGATFFALATVTKSMKFTYAGVVGYFVAYTVAGNLLSDIQNERLASLLDPMGFGAFSIQTKYWTTVERNTLVAGFDGVFIQNRLLWMAVGLVILGLAYRAFSFTVRTERGKKSEARETVRPLASAVALAGPKPELIVERDFSLRAARKQFFRMTRLETRNVVRSLPFAIMAAMGILNALGGSFTQESLYGTPVLPVTYLLLEVIQSNYLLFVVIVITVFAGELVWQERSLRFSDVHDALPVRGWLYWSSKLSAMVVVLALLLGIGGLTEIGWQFFHDYTNFELGLYLKGLLLEIGTPFLLILVLAFALQVMANHKFAGFLLMLLYFISAPIMNAMGYSHYLYRFAQSPGGPYSDMNLYGHFVTPQFWYMLYWGFGAVVLLVMSHLFWVRGRDTAFGLRLALARGRMGIASVGTLVLALAAFGATGGFIYYNTSILNEHRTSDDVEEAAVRYETEYKQFEGVPQPKIASAYADVDIYPETRAVDIDGHYILVNTTGALIEELHVVIDPSTTTWEYDVPGGTATHESEESGWTTYELSTPLAPGDSLRLGYRTAVRNEGFENQVTTPQLVRNGTFFNNFDFFPHLGYAPARELTNPNDRRKHDLPERDRMPKLGDEAALETNYVVRDADWMDFETVVSTTSDQIALAPGYLEREWEEDGRRYFHYKMDAPILGFFACLSADWQVARDTWNDVEIAVYHHEKHPYNTQRMIDAVKKSLDYFTEEFGPYQHRQVRIIEFPRYARFAQAFPNTIPYSESIGFIAKIEEEEQIDYVFYVTAHEVAHQWWAHQVIGSYMQGSTVLSETMAQYSAMMVMEKEYGPEKMRRFLKYELDTYLRGRGSELIAEMPLLEVENQGYIHYRKGSLVMYALRDYLGEDVLNSAIRRFRDDKAFTGPPYTTSLEFLSYIREVVPDDRMQVIEDLFETITLWDNRATEFEVTDGAGGQMARITIEASKLRADELGVETEVPMDDWIDVGVFGEVTDDSPPEGVVLYLEKHRIRGDTVLEIPVRGTPVQAGIDPLNKLIDRNPEDNLARVTTGG